MAGYQKPGITVTEVDTPNTAIVLDRPTVVGLVGQARGNEVRSEVIRLVDRDEVALSGLNAITSPPTTFVVRDINRLNTVYDVGSSNDYTLSTDANGVTTISRSLYTTMTSTESVVVVMKTTSPAGVVTASTQFDYSNPTETLTPSNGGTIAVTGGSPGDTDISVQKAGRYALTTDYTVNLSNGNITRANSAYGPEPADCHIFSGQTVYVTYSTNNGANEYVDESVILTGTTSTPLANTSEGVDTDSIVVRNKAGMGGSTDEVAVFVGAQNGNAGVDFQFEYYPSESAPEAFSMTRNVDGPTTMGLDTNSVNVRVDYQYIPTNYYVPTLFTNFHEVEAKYGPAFNSDGSIANPISAGAYMCFRAGSNEIIAQAIYTIAEDGSRLAGDPSNVNDWVDTLESLKDQTAINVLVPVVGQNSSISDATIAAIQSRIVDHINYMQQDNEYVVAVFGEDATENGAISSANASSQTLRDHAQVLSQQSYPERTVLIGPGAFKMINPVTGKNTLIGGQYAAAAIAGILARDPVQSSLTRKNIPGITDVAVYKNESEKNTDASSGLLVVEAKNGVVRVRHAITTAIGDPNKSELNAMRSKFFMIESIKRTLDDNVIGRVLSDSRAPFIVSTNVSGVLEFLKNSGAITSYSSVTATVSPSTPTAMTVRFTYSLPYAINNIEVALSLDTVTGNINAQ